MNIILMVIVLALLGVATIIGIVYLTIAATLLAKRVLIAFDHWATDGAVRKA